MTEFIFHELERAVSHTMRVISEVGATPTSVSTLKDQLQTLHKRVAAFDELTGEKRQTKSRFDLCELVREVLGNHEREFARHSMDLVLDLPEVEFTIRAVRGMVIQILENLVVNAAYWLKRQAEYEEGFVPQLVVTVDDEARYMMVQDNGSRRSGVAQGADIPTVRHDQAFGYGQGSRVVHSARHGRVPRMVTGHGVTGRPYPVESHKWLRTAVGITVNYATQIINSFKASIVDRILVVDDAYDPPALSEKHMGELLEVLERPDLREYLTAESLGEEGLQSAIEALVEGDYDHEAIGDAISSLFNAYVHRRPAEVDPGGEFAGLKGSSLEALDPLLELLEHCGDRSCIRRVGRDAALRVCREWRPDLILMDFFLSPPDRTTGASTRKEELADRKSSINLLKSILQLDGGVTPAVILMSSEDVQGRAQRYRSSLEGRVTALRFGFLNKNWIRRAGDGLVAVGDAADVLMETSGSFEFGRTLEAALRHWKCGAEAGLKELYKELRDFDAKDFAYLLRFRLYEEGEPFADYLEGFLGESLRAVVDDKVEWSTEEFSRLNDEELTEAIEGAHSVPSPRIARLFDRMRFNSRENRVRGRFGLGDLFIGPDHKSVRMVITPDCDLVVRGGSRGASRLLTVGGTIRGLSEEKALAGNLIFYQTPKAITWELKDVMSHDFTDDMSKLQVGETAYSYYATMRALATQTIQKEVLGDLARVGSAVSPTVDVGAPVKVYLKTMVENRLQVTELDDLEEAHAQVFMPRGGSEKKMRALFTSRFVRTLVARLEGIDDADLFPDDRGHRTNWIGNATRVRKAMLHDGLELPGEGVFKLVTSIGRQKGKNWLEIVVDVADEALINMHGTDPLAP